MRVLTILARFGTERYPHAEDELEGIVRRWRPSAGRSVIVVDNALPPGVERTEAGRTVIGGDNRAFEFSAFDCALEYVGSDIWSYDLVHFATSAFNTLYTAYLERFDAGLLSVLVNRPACVGHIDCYNEPVEILNFRSQHWIRSCFFVMPPAEVKALGSFVSLYDAGQLFSGRPEAPFRPEAPLGLTYRRYITDWLTGSDIGQRVQWHSSFVLGHDTLATFERKALCIMNEHLLAIRLRALGCHLVDVTWLSTRVDKRARRSPSLTTNWCEQLAARDRDRLIVDRRHGPTTSNAATG
jgi:hypothetical protein